MTFANIKPQHYILKEISTVEGYELLEGSVSINAPLYMTKEEIIRTGADISKAKYSMTHDAYFFTEQTYTIHNGKVIGMPFTGMNNTAKIYIPLICGLGLAGVVSCLVVFIPLGLLVVGIVFFSVSLWKLKNQ